MNASQNYLNEFTDAVGQRLQTMLKDVSLDLIDIGLRSAAAAVITPGVDVMRLHVWAIRPETREGREFSIRFGADVQSVVDSSIIAPLCDSIVKTCVEYFYPDSKKPIASA